MTPHIKRRPRALSILDAINDPALFAPWFKRPETWAAWLVFLRALFALPLIAQDDVALFETHTARTTPPAVQASAAWLIVGRRGGKSFIVALIAVFLACFRDYSRYLAPGERGVVMIIAADRKQARVIFRYARALLKGVPMLARLIVSERAEAIELSNGIDVEVHTSSFRSVRGYTVAAALLDEVAYWPAEDSANPDAEIVAALRPAMATIPGALLIGSSSPYARRGVLWDAHREHFGRDGDVLVWQADSRAMNPTLPQALVERAYADDPAAAAAEYGAEFRRDIEAFLPVDAIEAVTIEGRRELPFVAGAVYRAFVDPSGGSSDSMTLGIAHATPDGHRVLDLLRERRPPFSPEAVVEDFTTTLKQYGLSEVVGDKYAGEWPRERFQKSGITYRVSERTKSELYGDFLPLVMSARAELLDDERLQRQLARLERRTSRAGRDAIDHGPGGHDDLANVCAGALVLAKGHVALDLATQAFVPDSAEQQAELDAHMRDLEFNVGRDAPWDL